MDGAILVLQYPDSHLRRTVALAATRSPLALRAFKVAVLEDARIAVDRDNDDLLSVQHQLELYRLQEILELLVPSGECS